MEDGKHVPNDDLIEGFQTDFDKTKLDTGVRKWTWFVKKRKWYRRNSIRCNTV